MISLVGFGSAINRCFNLDIIMVFRTVFLPKGVSFLLDHILKLHTL